MEKHKALVVSVILTSDCTFDVEISEPESGDHITIHCIDGEYHRADNNRKIGEEICSWVSVMREELEDEEKEN